MVMFLKNLFLKFFWLTIRKKMKLEKSENMMKKQSVLEKKTFSSFQKASLTKLEGAKYPSGSWVSCINDTPLNNKSKITSNKFLA